MARGSLNTPYLLLSGTIIIGITAIFIFYQPMLAEINETRQSIESKQAELAERERFVRTLDQKISELQAQGQHEQHLNIILPTDDSVEDMIRIINEAGNASGGAIETITNRSDSLQANINSERARGDAVSIPQGITPLGFNVTFSGSYQQLRVFLEQLETAPRLNDVTNLSISRNPEQLDRVGAELLLQFYKHDTSTGE